MNSHLVSTLTTVNAPYSEQLTGHELALCLSDLQLAKAHPGQVSSFLGEVPLVDQIEFATAFHVSMDALKSVAHDFAEWSGESYLLAA
jgi:hypothetical protein